jgi:ATP-dependent DNA helicase RecQ
LLESDVYYVSQWLAYLDEIKLEDFENYTKTVTVSTIHKSKGMEFDKVIMLVNETPKNDEERRLYYVGMTRSKNELTILRHGQKSFARDSIAQYEFNDTPYAQEEKVVTLIMGLKDIQLGFRASHNDADYELLAGEDISFEMRGKAKTFCVIHQNKVVGFLSKNFHHKLQVYLNKGYGFGNSMIEYAVYWQSPDSGEYIKHPLCKILLIKH